MRGANKSISVKRKTGCGSLYVNVEHNENCEPIRVQITLGKSGGCASAQLSAIGSLITHMLNKGVDLSFIFDEKIDESLIHIRCPQWQHEAEADDVEDSINKSCPDVIAKSIRYALGKLKEMKP